MHIWTDAEIALAVALALNLAASLFIAGRLFERVSNLAAEVLAIKAERLAEAVAETPTLLKLNTLEANMAHVLQDLAELKGRPWASSAQHP